MDSAVHEQIADELRQAEQNRRVVPLLTARYPDMTIEDSYAVQRICQERGLAAGRTLAGHKIGLTSRVMQEATGITEPDYGVLFADQIYESGSSIEFDSFSNVRIEVELAFVLGTELKGPGVTMFDVLDATTYVVPALEILSSRIELPGRTIVDTISDNAALGAVVIGGSPVAPSAVDLRWVSSVLFRNETIQDSGVAAAILGHPALGVAWLANKLAWHGDSLQRGEIVLAGSFTRPMWIERGDTVLGDYRDLGVGLVPLRVNLPPSFATVLDAAQRPQIGMWVCSGSALVAEICAGSGLDWLLIDMEHVPNGLEAVTAQLQAVAAYPITPLVRVPVNDTVVIKQVLDLGAQNLLVPMVDSAAEATVAVRAARYPPDGVRGVGSALGRAARWNRIEGYLPDAANHVSVTVQIESRSAVERVESIGSSGVDAMFIGPSDLAASLGLLGQQDHPDVVAAVEHCIAVGRGLGVPVGVNAFAPATAERYLAAGASFILVGADVALLARGSEALTHRFIESLDQTRASY